MKKEIAAVVFFLKRLIRKAERLQTEQVDQFVERLTVALQEKFRGHWYPDNPSKGQAFRCIRMNGFQGEDPDVGRACQESGVLYGELGLPLELTLWVDPGEVCCRYGEKNHAFTVARFSGDDEEDKEDVTRKVTSAVEKVTSDYHSGSSSSDEDASAREACPPPALPQRRHAFQMNPAAPTWHPGPKKKMAAGRGFHHPHPHYGPTPPGRTIQPIRHQGWTRSGHGGSHGGIHGGIHGYWGSIPNMTPC